MLQPLPDPLAATGHRLSTPALLAAPLCPPQHPCPCVLLLLNLSFLPLFLPSFRIPSPPAQRCSWSMLGSWGWIPERMSSMTFWGWMRWVGWVGWEWMRSVEGGGVGRVVGEEL